MSKNRAARRIAQEEGISYVEALSRVRDHQKGEKSLITRLREAVESACDGMAGEDVRNLEDEFPWGSGPDFREIGVPDGSIEGTSIDVVEPDLDTVQWDPAETLEGGTQVGTVEVDATVSFDGYMYKSDVYGHDDVTILEFNWNEKMSWVAFSRTARLQWRVVVDPGQWPELEFEGSLAPPEDPHSLI